MIKYIGIFLVFLGIAMIFSGLFFSIQVFLLEETPPEIFKADNLLLTELLPSEEGETLDMDIEIEDILPISEALNVVAVYLFATLLIFGGARIVVAGASTFKQAE